MSTNVRQLFDLAGKTALVTGGSRGLGLQIAEALGEAGAKVMLTSRKASDLEESAAQLKTHGIEALWVAADASQPSEIVRVSQDAIARLGHVDILVNNAGATWGAAAEDHPLEAWDKVMNLNIRSIFLMCQAIGKHSMIPRRQGKIINVASIAGLAGNSADMSMVAYNTSKAAVVNFTRTLAGEWGKYNI
ncbi:MAG: SDR family NAD(P)-dependent oxidoreductase, partial [Caldimonas sp.]